MEIGDKVKFNKYLPIAEDGTVKTLIVPRTVLTLDGEKVKKIKIYPWRTTRKEGVSVSYSINKIDTKELSGVYIGMLRKKLSRSYRLTEQVERSLRVPISRGRIVQVRDPFGDPAEIVNLSQVERVRPRTWTSKNPRRLDDPNKLDELAIIAVSKRKRYVVAMKDIIEYNIKDKLKIV